jgi:hypothetical protein
VLSFGHVHYIRALKYAMADGRSSDVITELRKALAYGLRPDDEVDARFNLGLALQEAAAEVMSSAADFLNSPIFKEGLGMMESAAVLDRQGNFGHFVDPLNRALLRRLDYIYLLMFDTMPDQTTHAAEIMFLEQKLRLFDYLPTNPLLKVLLKVAALHASEGRKDIARGYLMKLNRSEPVDRVDEKGGEMDVRTRARNLLSRL